VANEFLHGFVRRKQASDEESIAYSRIGLQFDIVKVQNGASEVSSMEAQFNAKIQNYSLQY